MTSIPNDPGELSLALAAELAETADWIEERASVLNTIASRQMRADIRWSMEVEIVKLRGRAGLIRQQLVTLGVRKPH